MSAPPAATALTGRQIAVAYALLALNMAVWAGHSVIGRLAAGEIPPMALNFWRWALSLLILLPFGWPVLRRQWPLIRAHWRMLALGGHVMTVGFSALYYFGLNYTTSINASLIGNTMPVYVVLITWLLRMEYLSVRQAAGMALSFTGVLVIVVRGDPGVLLTLSFNVGDLVMIVAFLGLALYSVSLRRLAAEFHALTLMCAMMALSMPALTVLYGWEFAETGPFVLDGTTLTIVAYVVLGPGVIAYYGYLKGVRLVGANRAAMTNNLVPVLTAVFAVPALGESLELYHAVGFLVTFAGLYLCLFGAGGRLQAAGRPG